MGFLSDKAEEREGLSADGKHDGLHAELVQHPLLGWVALLILAVLLPLLFLTDIEMQPLVWVAFIPVFGAQWLQRKATIDIRYTRVTVKGWLGRVPVPREVVLNPPVSLTWQKSGAVRLGNRGRDEVRVWRVWLESADGAYATLEKVQCTSAELEQLEEDLERVGAHVEDRQGDGEGEVPKSLRQIVRAVPEKN